jgi:septum site-determining protein MinC
VPAAASSTPTIRLRGRSFMALMLAPEPPTERWLDGLDALIARSPGFFSGRAIVVDVSRLPPLRSELAQLIAELNRRGIRIMGLEGADPQQLGLGLPPPMTGGRPAADVDLVEASAKRAATAAPAAPRPASLLLETPVRSGQSIVFPEGDVTIVGSVASGSEIVAGGSIHVYGALRGRALAGSTGNPKARIFCQKFEAELISIDGLYQIADELKPELRGRPMQIWLDDDTIMMTALD